MTDASARWCQGCGVVLAELTHMCRGLLVPGTSVVFMAATVPLDLEGDEDAN